jgi:protein-S-isoprenylcysteine O-methyltransferase Ste14
LPLNALAATSPLIEALKYKESRASGAASERDCPALHEEYWRLLPVRNTAGRTAVASVVALGACAQHRRIDPDSSAFREGSNIGDMNDVTRRALRSSLFGIVALAALLFIPAGTFDYWQAWLFMAVFGCTSGATTVYLALRDPKLLERRMNVGPRAEKEPAQKIIMVLATLGFIAMLVFPAIDHRFGWSSVPASVSVLGDALIALGFLFIFFVFRENSYGASTIQIAEGQTVISTGPYALVRHPMYAGALVMSVGIPLALDSWWGLFVLFLLLPVLIWRLLDEERFLRQNLPGYTEYQTKVKYRLVPFIW